MNSNISSSEFYKKAKVLMPGGVSSPVRAIKPYPFYVARGSGSEITTVDGDKYTDFCCAYGPLILGHCHDAVKQAISDQIEEGWLYGTPSPHEIRLAEKIIKDHKSVDMVRFVSSGSEATMAAIRLARGYTGRHDIIKIEGGFHGAHDGVLVQAGSGCTTLGQPDSAGVVPDFVSHTRQVPYNNTEALSELLEKNADSVAAFILEPVMGNIGPILPENGYLSEVRKITQEHDVLLIFDEVITGYRLGIGGAQNKYNVQPDLTTFGKIIGGGLPIGAFCGRRDIMKFVAPAGSVYQAGTFSGNPLSLSAGFATLNWLSENYDIYGRLEKAGNAIGESLKDRDGSFVSNGSMFKFFFRSLAPVNYAEARECDTDRFSDFWKKMLKSGIFIPPSQFETNFISAAHTDQDIEKIISAYQSCL